VGCSTCKRLLWLAGFLAEHASELVELVFSTRPSYDDAESQRAVVNVLRAALQDESFLKAFAGALVRCEGPCASAQVLQCPRLQHSTADWRYMSFPAEPASADA
jgi:hypothetical protein